MPLSDQRRKQKDWRRRRQIILPLSQRVRSDQNWIARPEAQVGTIITIMVTAIRTITGTTTITSRTIHITMVTTTITIMDGITIGNTFRWYYW